MRDSERCLRAPSYFCQTELVMKIVGISEIRRNLSALLKLVERGEVVQIVRRGRVIAKMIPFGGTAAERAWKRPGVRIVAPGASLSKAVLEERKASR